MNAANLCPTPRPVTEEAARLALQIDGDQSFQNRARFGPLREEARARLAAYLRALPEEVALVRNTSEANNIVIDGLDLGPGDEVLLWDQNHPSNSTAWDVRAERRGFRVRRVATPPDPAGPESLLRPFLREIRPATRVVAVTHVSNVTGVRLPVRELCVHARERDVLTLVDGAQTFGADALDLHELGCDFFTGSAHKWFMGPKEVGILFARAEVAARVWPGVVSVGWEGSRDRGALRFETLGQRDDARLAAMTPATAFHEEIGPERIQERIRELVAALRTGIGEAVPGTRFVTPEPPDLSGGVLIFRLPGVPVQGGYQALYRDHGIGGAAMGGEDGGIRLCPHVYNVMDDVERVVEAVSAVALGVG
jgi:selenocysteine lyase/cysteine desulfurase